MAVHIRPAELTERQRAVVELVRQGWSNREVAAKLEISEDGVKAHLSRLYLRYGVTNRVELLASIAESASEPRAAPMPLPTLRALSQRADARAAGSRGPDGSVADAKLAAVRDVLTAVDAALGLVTDLPAETTESVITAIRSRLGGALSALDDAQRAVAQAARESAV